MVNSNKISGRIAELKTSRQKISAAMGISAYTLGRKLSNKTPMTLDEANELQSILKISDSEFRDYFFIQ